MVGTLRADEARAGITASTTPAPASRGAAATGPKDIVQLTPFSVTTTRDTGYFAENTLAGSRLNTNLADIAAFITVVTKQQMEDTASLDINDVFKYEAGTEGSNTYSPVITDRGTAKEWPATPSGMMAGLPPMRSPIASVGRLRQTRR